MHRRLLASSFAAICLSAHAQFSGELVLGPEGCQAKGLCYLKENFRFKDAASLDWEASAGDPTDGATIPPIFQPFIGKPFEASFIKAAVIHDHYCRRQVRTWRATHRVFYEGLLSQGLPKAKAKLMYYAVYLGGPKWVKLIPGQYCSGNCIKSIKDATPAGVVTLSRAADYASSVLPEDLASLDALLSANDDALSLEQLERRARFKRPDDFYMRTGDEVEMPAGGVLQ